MIPNTLETFVVTARAGSFQKASEQLFISSTALVKQINQLEKTTKLTLFRRTNKGLELTQSGRIFFEASERILHEYYDALQQARGCETGRKQIVRVGVSQINPFRAFAGRFQYDRSQFARFSTCMVPISAEYKDFTEHLRTLGAEVDVIPYFCGHEGLNAVCRMHCLARLPLRVAVPEGHPLAAKPVITYDDLNGQEVVSINGEANIFYAHINETIRKNAPRVHLRMANYYDFLLLNYAAQNNQLLIVGDYLRDVHPQLLLRPAAWDLTLPYGIHYAKNPSDTVRAFIQAFIDSGIDGTPENAPLVEL